VKKLEEERRVEGGEGGTRPNSLAGSTQSYIQSDKYRSHDGGISVTREREMQQDAEPCNGRLQENQSCIEQAYRLAVPKTFPIQLGERASI
jgi:hypothetical protein